MQSSWALSFAFAAIAFGCGTEQTSVLIEIQSKLSEELTRVDVEIRDGDDQKRIDQFSFESSANPQYRVPFSFRVVPGEQGAARFVVNVVGYRREVVLAEARHTIAFVQRVERRHVVKLVAADDGRRDDAATGTDAGAAGSGMAGSAGERGDAAISGSSGTGSPPASGTGGASASDSGEASAGSSGSGVSGAGAGSGGLVGSSGTSAGGSSGLGGAGAVGASGSSGAGGGSGGASGAGAGGSDVAGMGGAAGSTGTGTVTGKLLSGKDYTADVTYLGRGYVVRNGVDGSGLEQTIRYENTSFSVVSVTGTAQAGTSWPVVFYGYLYGKASMGTSLPLRVDQIHNIDLSFKSNAGAVSGSYALVTSLWFGKNIQKTDDSVPTAGMIEIWHGNHGLDLPAAAPTATAITVEGVPGTYDFYEQDCFWDGQTCITYLRNPPAADFSGDLRPFLSDAMNRAPAVLGSWYLNAIITGFAIERSSSGLQLRELTAAVR